MSLKLIFILCLLWNSLKHVSACRPKNTKPPTATVGGCLSKMGGNVKQVVESVEQGDTYCKYKYAWTAGGSVQNAKDVASGDYVKEYGYEEPTASAITGGSGVAFDASCEASTSSKPNYAITQWFCLEWCEQNCVNMAKRISSGDKTYPFTKISCEHKGLECTDTVNCGCTDTSGTTCSVKTNGGAMPTVQDMIDKYNKTCMNCYYNRSEAKCTWKDLLGGSGSPVSSVSAVGGGGSSGGGSVSQTSLQAASVSRKTVKSSTNIQKSSSNVNQQSSSSNNNVQQSSSSNNNVQQSSSSNINVQQPSSSSNNQQSSSSNNNVQQSSSSTGSQNDDDLQQSDQDRIKAKTDMITWLNTNADTQTTSSPPPSKTLEKRKSTAIVSKPEDQATAEEKDRANDPKMKAAVADAKARRAAKRAARAAYWQSLLDALDKFKGEKRKAFADAIDKLKQLKKAKKGLRGRARKQNIIDQKKVTAELAKMMASLKSDRNSDVADAGDKKAKDVKAAKDS